MKRWRNYGSIWTLWPSRPIGLIEMIGGTYLASNPQLSYRKLLESLAAKNLAVHTWAYLPELDHQAQSNLAWKEFRKARQTLERRVGPLPKSIRMGHSLGCKLHLLAPDGGRNSESLIAISFNNFAANQSIPMLKKVSKRIGLISEFSPSPEETLRQIKEHYLQPINILIRFRKDKLDQTSILLNCLKGRTNDSSKELTFDGGHLTPASAGVRDNFLGEWANNQKQVEVIREIVDLTCKLSFN